MTLVAMPRRRLATAVPGGPWTLVLVVGLLWSAKPTSALYFVNVSSPKPTEDHRPTSTISRCSPASHDVLWTRLNLAAPRLTLNRNDNDDDDDDDAEDSRTHLTPVSQHKSLSSSEFQTSPSDVPQIVATSTSSRHRRLRGRRRRWRRRGGSERRGRQGRGRRRPAATAWNCRLQKRWKRMPSGVFPTYIQTGSCRRQPTCMLGMYACRPRRYIVKVLRRIGADDSDDGCRPVPVAGPDVVYEEAWSLVDVPVTVACECSRRRRSGTYHHTPTNT